MIPSSLNPVAGGNAVVLSGGASLGASQVGMMKALVEAGVEVDCLVGTSAGAINAAWMAGDPSMDGLDRLARTWIGLRRHDVFPVSPWHGLFAAAGRRRSLVSDSGLRRLLEQYLAFDLLESAPIPVHVVAVDVLSGLDVLLSTGPALEAVLASASIPGVLPPVEIGGRWYMDGGVINNTPISHAAQLGVGTIWVLPAGYPCALSSPPRTALGMALQGLSTLVEHRIGLDVGFWKGTTPLKVVPPLCPITVSPADFSQASDLIRRAYVSTRDWLAAGCPDVGPSLGTHRHDRVGSDPVPLAALDLERGGPSADRELQLGHRSQKRPIR